MQNRLIQTSQTGGQWYSDTFPFSIPCSSLFCATVSDEEEHFNDIVGSREIDLTEDEVVELIKGPILQNIFFVGIDAIS